MKVLVGFFKCMGMMLKNLVHPYIQSTTVLCDPYRLIAVLDEATSSLSEDDESSLYSALDQLNITVLSIGHRSTLQRVCIDLLCII